MVLNNKGEGLPEVQWTQVVLNTEFQKDQHAAELEKRMHTEKVNLQKACKNIVNTFRNVDAVVETAPDVRYSEVEDTRHEVAEDKRGSVVTKAMGHTQALNDGINVTRTLLLANRGKGFSYHYLMSEVTVKMEGTEMPDYLRALADIFGLPENRISNRKQDDVEYTDSKKTRVTIKK